MTQREVIKAVHDLGMSCRVYDGEFRIAPSLYTITGSKAEKREMQERAAYYTTDAQDALDTAKAFAAALSA